MVGLSGEAVGLALEWNETSWCCFDWGSCKVKMCHIGGIHGSVSNGVSIMLRCNKNPVEGWLVMREANSTRMGKCSISLTLTIICYRLRGVKGKEAVPVATTSRRASWSCPLFFHSLAQSLTSSSSTRNGILNNYALTSNSLHSLIPLLSFR